MLCSPHLCVCVCVYVCISVFVIKARVPSIPPTMLPPSSDHSLSPLLHPVPSLPPAARTALDDAAIEERVQLAIKENLTNDVSRREREWGTGVKI